MKTKTLTINGLELVMPANFKFELDGNTITFLPVSETEVVEKIVEKIRVVEVPVQGKETVVERVRVVEVEKPCNKPHYPQHPTWPSRDPWITWSGNTSGRITSTGNGTTTWNDLT